MKKWLEFRFKGSTSVSSELPINMGVHQGSLFGPVLFLIYVNDIPNIVKECKCHLFADYTTLYQGFHYKPASGYFVHLFACLLLALRDS